VNNSDVLDVLVRGGMERFLSNGKVKGTAPPPLAWLYEKSHFARFVLFEGFDYTHYIVSRSERSRLAIEAMKKLEGLVLEFNHLLSEHGVDFALVIFPFRGELKRNQYDWLDRLQAFALEREIKLIDVKPYLYEKLTRGGKQLEDLYWPDDGHFTPLGYRYFAEAVLAGFAAGHFLSCSPIKQGRVS